MTTGWLLLLLLIVSSQSVDSQSTTDDETCHSGEAGLFSKLQSDMQRLLDNQLQLFQTIMNRLGKSYLQGLICIKLRFFSLSSDVGMLVIYRLIDYQPELFIAMLLENAAKEDKQKSASETSRKTLNYGIYHLKMP